MSAYETLEAWQKAMDLAVRCYMITESFPQSQRFGLVSQIHRAAASVPANIAEGQGRLSKREFRHFAGIARGSLMETETHLILANRLGYLADVDHASLMRDCAEVGRLLNGLMRWLNSPEDQPSDSAPRSRKR